MNSGIIAWCDTEWVILSSAYLSWVCRSSVDNYHNCRLLHGKQVTAVIVTKWLGTFSRSNAKSCDWNSIWFFLVQCSSSMVSYGARVRQNCQDLDQVLANLLDQVQWYTRAWIYFQSLHLHFPYRWNAKLNNHNNINFELYLVHLRQHNVTDQQGYAQDAQGH